MAAMPVSSVIFLASPYLIQFVLIGSTSETASSRPLTADTKEEDAPRGPSSASGGQLWIPEYSVMPSASDRGSLRTAAVEYLIDDEDQPDGAGAGAHDFRRPHTSATPGGRGGAAARQEAPVSVVRAKAAQHKPDVRFVAAFD
jgi:hypothetical protein